MESALTSLFFAQTAPSQSSPLSMLVPFVFIFVIFYFLLIRPARKRQKALDELVKNLKPGDRVATSGGLYGTVVAVTENRVQLRIADQVKVDVAKSAVTGLDENR
jgi:preprotein translocase subunit YajC